MSIRKRLADELEKHPFAWMPVGLGLAVCVIGLVVLVTRLGLSRLNNEVDHLPTPRRGAPGSRGPSGQPGSPGIMVVSTAPDGAQVVVFSPAPASSSAPSRTFSASPSRSPSPSRKPSPSPTKSPTPSPSCTQVPIIDREIC